LPPCLAAPFFEDPSFFFDPDLFLPRPEPDFGLRPPDPLLT